MGSKMFKDPIDDSLCKDIILIVELRTPAMPVGVGGGKERGGFHLNLRT